MQAQGSGAVCRVSATVLLAVSLAIPARPAPSGEEFHVSVEYYKFPSGLRVVFSTDHTAPTVCVGVYYRIGSELSRRTALVSRTYSNT